MRPSRSTSATSRNLRAPSSTAVRDRSASPPFSASIETATPFSNRISIPSIIVPSVRTSGRVERTTPSARSGSGVVVSSSDGRFGTNSIPSTVVSLAFCQSDVGRRPIVRSVPGPSKWTASSRSSVSRSPTAPVCPKRSRHASRDRPRRAARRARSPPRGGPAGRPHPDRPVAPSPRSGRASRASWTCAR